MKFDRDKKIRLFAFDLDGTLYLGDQSISGAVEVVSWLQQRYKVAFFTNNSTKTAKAIVEKLTHLGHECAVPDVYTSSFAAARYLKENNVDDVLVVGSGSLRDEIEEAGVHVADHTTAKNLVVGLDCEFTYETTAQALAVLGRGGKFIACNEDASFPVAHGRRLPGCGAMVGAIAAAAARGPDFVVGKPNTYILSTIARNYGVRPQEIVVVGDSCESDIAMALAYGAGAMLVHATKASSLGDAVLVFNHLQELLHYVREG